MSAVLSILINHDGYIKKYCFPKCRNNQKEKSQSDKAKEVSEILEKDTEGSLFVSKKKYQSLFTRTKYF